MKKKTTAYTRTPPITRRIPRCECCGSANLHLTHSERINDPDDGNAIVWRKQWALCLNCGSKFHIIEE